MNIDYELLETQINDLNTVIGNLEEGPLLDSLNGIENMLSCILNDKGENDVQVR